MSVALTGLHELLKKLAEAEATLTDGPRRIVIAERLVKQAEQAIEDQKAAIRNCRKSADDLNLQLKTRESDIARLQGQLNTASSNKEYDIIKGQIDAAKKERGDIEEKAFEAMETADAAQLRLKALESDLQGRLAGLNQIRTEVDAERPALEANILELQSEVRESEKVIPGEGRAVWERLRKAHGAAAVCPVEDGFCEQCSTKVTTQDLVRVRMNEFVCCRGCGRVHYLTD